MRQYKDRCFIWNKLHRQLSQSRLSTQSSLLTDHKHAELKAAAHSHIQPSTLDLGDMTILRGWRRNAHAGGKLFFFSFLGVSWEKKNFHTTDVDALSPFHLDVPSGRPPRPIICHHLTLALSWATTPPCTTASWFTEPISVSPGLPALRSPRADSSSPSLQGCCVIKDV